MDAKSLTIMRCSKHSYWAVSIDDANGGSRITPSKCCGSWSDVKSWRLSEREWRDIANQATEAADELAKDPT